MNVDILPNYDHSNIREYVSSPGAKTFREWWGETPVTIENCDKRGYHGRIWWNPPYSTDELGFLKKFFLYLMENI